MRNFITTLILFSTLAVPASAFALGLPFGGPIIAVRPCYNFTGFVLTVGPPTPGEFIADFSTLRYLFQTPYHPAQWLLGLIGPFSTCDINPGDGFTGIKGAKILFHGSSK